MLYRIAVVIAALAWYCNAIQINVDTVYTAGGTAKLTIKNTSAVDSVYLDTVYVRNLSPAIQCTEIGFDVLRDHSINWFYPVKNSGDTFFVSVLARSRLGIRQGDSLVLENVKVGSCLFCVGIATAAFIDQCILKAAFIPNKGARDSVVFIGPRLTGGTKFKTRPNIFSSGKIGTPTELYDLSGRHVGNAAWAKKGVYFLVSRRQCVVGRRLLIDKR